jgi:sugar O-acyltransferase (sialic acid O-acetyltransferase NeuD family)
MIIAGSKGFAKEVLEILAQQNELENVAFFDNVSESLADNLFGRFPILCTNAEVEAFFKKQKSYTLGMGGPLLRQKMHRLLHSLGGEFTSTVSPRASIGHFGNVIGNGCNIMTGTVITNDIQIGEGCLINLNCTIGHDSIIGEFVEMSPGVHVSGGCIIGRFSNLGTNATILPKVKLGENVIVGAGAVVTQDVPDNSLAVGIPAKVIRSLEPLKLT